MTVLALPFDLEWSEPFRERRSYLTTVFQADDGTEQRQQLRARARRTYLFRVWAELADAARLDAFLETCRNQDVAVPFWPHQTATSAEATAAGSSIPVATDGFDFQAGQYALLLTGVTSYELVQIGAVSSSALTTVDPLAATWPSGTPILPCFVSRLANARTARRATPAVTVADLEFAIDPFAVPVGQSAGLDIRVFPLSAAYAGDPADAVAAGVDRLDSLTGGWSERTRWDESVTDIEYPLQLTAAEVAQLWAWYDRVLGALGISWVPSWHDALTLAQTVADDATELVISASAYTDLQFPRTARRQLAIIGADGTVTRRLVTGAVDNLDGTESLTIDLAPFRVLTPGLDMLAQLRACRLVEDAVEVAWRDPDGADATLRFHEVVAGGDASSAESGGLGGEEPGTGSAEVVECLMDGALWSTVEDYGGSFTFTDGDCAGVVMNGLWSVGIGGGNGVLKIERTFSGLDPNSYYTFDLDAQVTQGTYNDFFSLVLVGGSHTPAYGTGNYNPGGAPGLQHLSAARNPDADGNLTVVIGAGGIEYGDSHYEMTMTAMAFALGGPI